MPRTNAPLLAFNRGEISPLALARVDIERTRLSAETMCNFFPKTLGAMIIRPGLGYLGSIAGNNPCNVIPFVAGTVDTALLELTNGVMRVWIDGALVSRPSVSTSISNGTFSSSSGWTDSSTGGGTLAFGGTGLILSPNAAGGVARCTKQVTVSGGDANKEHGLKIQIPEGFGPVTFRCGSASQGQDYIEETRLLEGWHHLSFTPTGDFHVTFEHQDRYATTKRVTSVAIEAAGTVSIVTPWATADIDNLQWTQSADVVFVACDGVRQMRIERRAPTAWSVVTYRAFDGPFVGKTANVKLTPGASIGDTTLTASAAFFLDDHEGALFRLFHDGQNFTMKLAGAGEFTDPIRVTGVEGDNYNERAFSVTTTGTWSGTLSTRRSIQDEEVGFGDYPRDASAGTTVGITTNTTYSNEDTDDNLIVWYRVEFKPGAYTSGTANVAFAYPGGGDYGLVRVRTVNSSTSADVEVLRLLRGTTITANWSEGAWSAIQGWPTSVALHEGRLWWFSGAQIFGSVSDNYESFDQDFEGDAGPIIRSIGEGPVDAVNFTLALARLIIGTAGGELVLKSSSIDEPMTPTNFSIKPVSNIGSKSGFPAVEIDEAGAFVSRSGKKLYQIAPGDGPSGYVTTDLTLLHPKILDAGVVSLAVQRDPDTRLHVVLADGSCAILTYDRAEDVLAWHRVETAGFIERVAVLPDEDEDQVYYVVKRTIDGSTVRYLEKYAVEADCAGGVVSKLADSFLVYSGVSTATITGLSHLEGEDVVVWAAGAALQESDGDGGYEPRTFTVASGSITLPAAVTSAVVGLPYTAQFKSAKLAYAAAGGTALNQKKRAAQVGLILGTTHHRGLKVGGTFDAADPLPTTVDGAAVADDTIYEEFDAPMFPVPGDWDTDSRLCIEGQAPYPATILAAVVGIETNG